MFMTEHERGLMLQEHQLLERIRKAPRYKFTISRALYGAVLRDEFDLADLYLALGANPGMDGSRALILAAEKGYFNLVVRLHEAGGDVTAYNSQALISAARNGHTGLVFYLAGRGANPRANNDEAIILAAEHKHGDTVKMLIGLGASANARNGQLLIILAENGMNSIIEFALDLEADPTAQNSECLIKAIQHDHKETADILYNAGANLSNEALIEAIWCNSMIMLKWLIEKGINIHEYNDKAFKLAREWRRKEILEVLEQASLTEGEKSCAKEEAT